jgi:hypothetical protein
VGDHAPDAHFYRRKRILPFRDGFQRVETVHFRHLEIHQRDIGTMTSELLNRIPAVSASATRTMSGSSEINPAIPARRVVVDGQSESALGSCTRRSSAAIPER